MASRSLQIARRFGTHLQAACCLGAAAAAALSTSAAAQAPPAVFGIRPGASIQAEVELLLGEARGRPGPHFAYREVFEYAPPRDAPDASRLVVVYFPETRQVARIDVHLASPLPADPLRAELGLRLMARPAADGGSEEIYYPKLQALVMRKGGDPAMVDAVSYLSPRYLGAIFVLQAEQHFQANRLDEARVASDKVVLIDPLNVWGYIGQARWHRAQRNPDEAVARLTAATQAGHSPLGRSIAWEWLGHVYWQDKKDLDGARQALEKAISLGPGLTSPYVTYARFLRAQKQEDAALAQLRRALEVDTASVPARREISDLLYEKPDYAAALPHLAWLARWAESEDGRREPPDVRGSAFFRYGYALSETGRAADAVAYYEKDVQLRPKSANTWNNLGSILYGQGNVARALESYEKGLAADEKHVLLLRNSALALVDAGKPDEALRRLAVALAAEPGGRWTMLQYARVYATMKKKREAMEWLRKAVAAGYKNPRALAEDKHLVHIRKDGDFKKLLESMR